MILLPKDSWEIKITPQKGRGIFATKDIAPGVVIGDYIGRVIKTAEEDTSDKDGLYLMYYHDYASLYPVDINAPGIHLTNHSCTPNCWLYTYKGHTLFFTLRKIFAGEELTASYLLSPGTDCVQCRHNCLCDTNYCSGTMHLSAERFNEWNAFNEKQAKMTKRARIRYGYPLPKLTSYPESIPDHPIYTLLGSLEKPSRIMDDDTLPSIEKMRELIRESGQTLFFPSSKTKVIGIQNSIVISERE
jgi:hypothetical protein